MNPCLHCGAEIVSSDQLHNDNEVEIYCNKCDALPTETLYCECSPQIQFMRESLDAIAKEGVTAYSCPSCKKVHYHDRSSAELGM